MIIAKAYPDADVMQPSQSRARSLAHRSATQDDCTRSVEGAQLGPGIGQGAGAFTSLSVKVVCMALMPGSRRIVVMANSA